jgi:hypothetical protein
MGAMVSAVYICVRSVERERVRMLTMYRITVISPSTNPLPKVADDINDIRGESGADAMPLSPADVASRIIMTMVVIRSVIIPS